MYMDKGVSEQNVVFFKNLLYYFHHAIPPELRDQHLVVEGEAFVCDKHCG